MNITDDSASLRTQLVYGASDEDSILSLTTYDEIVQKVIEEQNRKDELERMSGIDELEDEADFDANSDYNDEEKSHITDHSNNKSKSDVQTDNIPVLTDDIKLHSVNITDDGVVIELLPNQLLYINSLFHILYKIITLKKMEAATTSRLNSVRQSKQSFMELLQSEKLQDRKISGGTAGGLSDMDAAIMSEPENYSREPRKRRRSLKNINHEKNKLWRHFLVHCLLRIYSNY